MLSDSPNKSLQNSLFNIIDQLDQKHPLIALGNAFDWQLLERELEYISSNLVRKTNPIRLMCGLLILKQRYNLSYESVVEQWRMNPYYQVFCGETEFQIAAPCHSAELMKFRKSLGKTGVEKLFALTAILHGEAAEEPATLVNTTAKERTAAYLADTKLAIKIIFRLNKLAKLYGIKQRRTFVKEVQKLRLQSRYFRPLKERGKERRILSRPRTIAGILLRELQRKLPENILEQYSECFSMYEEVLSQSKNDKDKVCSLHESDINFMAKGKDHKLNENGRKATVVSTIKSQVIVGVANNDELVQDSKTLASALQANRSRSAPIEGIDAAIDE